MQTNNKKIYRSDNLNNNDNINILPPRTGINKSTRGTLLLTIIKLKYIAESTVDKKNVIGRFKFWGEQKNHYISMESSSNIKFEIKCRNQIFADYLRDMKILVLQLVDSRNQVVLGVVNINFLLYLKTRIISEEDEPFMEIEGNFEIIKGSNKSNVKKIGEIELKIGCQYAGFQEKKQIRSPMINFQARNQQKEKEFPLLRYQQQRQQQQFKKQQLLKRQYELQLQKILQQNQNKQRKILSDGNGQPIQITKSQQKTEIKKKLKKNQLDFLYNRNPNQKKILREGNSYQAEILKLELQANELLSQNNLIGLPKSNNMLLKVRKIQWTNTKITHGDEVIIQVVYATFLNNKISYQNQNITCLNSNRNQVMFDHSILIHDIEKVKLKLIYFKVKSKKETIGQLETQLLNICNQSNYQLELTSSSSSGNSKISTNNNKKIIGKIIIDVQKINEYGQNDQYNKNKFKTNFQYKSEIQYQNLQKMNKKELPPLLFLIKIDRCELSNNKKYTTEINHLTQYQIIFKLQNNSYSTEKISSLNWNSHIICPINTKIKINQIICFELWKKQEDFLMAVGKIKLDKLNDIIQYSIVQQNLNPLLLFQSSLKLMSIIKNQLIGLLQIEIYCGTASQINKLNQKLRVELMRQNAISHRPERSNNLTENQNQESVKKIETNQTEEKYIQVIEDQQQSNQINLVETLTKFFEVMSVKKSKVDYLLSNININENISQDEFVKFLQGFLSQEEETQVLKILCTFFMEDSMVNILQFYKCFSSFINYNEIMIEQRMSLLKQVLSEMQNKKLSLDYFEEKINKASQFGFIAKPKLRDIFKTLVSNREQLFINFLQIFGISDQTPLAVGEFVAQLKAVKFGRNIQKIATKTIVFQIMIKESVEDVMLNDVAGLTLITNTLSAKDLNVRTICQLLESLKVEISYWEALLLIQSIKNLYKQDFELLQGRISPNTVLTWLKSAVESHEISRNDFNSNKNESRTINQDQQQQLIMVRQSEPSMNIIKTQPNDNAVNNSKLTKQGGEDEIVNIAKLLRDKDKFEYDQSESKAKISLALNQQENQSKYSNVLVDHPEISLKREDSPKKQPKRSNQETKFEKLNQNGEEEPILVGINMKILKYEIIQLKFSNSLEQQINIYKPRLYKVFIDLIDRHEVIIKKHKLINEFFSPKVFHEEININNINYYKHKGIRGLQFSVQDMNDEEDEEGDNNNLGFIQSKYICKGLFSIEDIFYFGQKQQNQQNQQKKKKSCVMYNRDNKIVGKIVMELSIVDEMLSKINNTLLKVESYVYVSILHFKNINKEVQKLKLSIHLNGKLMEADVKRFHSYKILLDENYYKSQIEIILESQKERFTSLINIESLINKDCLKVQIPVVNSINVYQGMMGLQLSKEVCEIIEAQVQKKDQQFIKTIKKKSLFVFIDDIITVETKRRLEGFFALFWNNREVSRSQKICVQKHKGINCVRFKNMKLNCEDYYRMIRQGYELNESQQLQLKFFSYPKNEVIGNCLLKGIFEAAQDKIGKKKYRILQGKHKNEDQHIRLGIYAIAVENPQKANISNIMKIFEKEYKYKIYKELKIRGQNNKQNVKAQIFKDILRKKFYFTFSEINFIGKYIFENQQLLGEIFVKEFFKNQKSKHEAEVLLSEFRFYDIDSTGFIELRQLRQILQIYKLDGMLLQLEKNVNTLQQTTKIDYIKYLGYDLDKNEDFENSIHNGSVVNSIKNSNYISNLKANSFNEIFNQIDELHTDFLKKFSQY